jgi:tetratricopeptide (TPR) repeat protein
MTRAALVGFVLLASTVALAGPDKGGIVDPFAKGSHPDSANRKRAGELSAQSAQHYKRGEFEVAAALLRQAYALYAEPNLLYNLARALEGMGDKAGAIDAYEQYLATAKQIEDRGAITRRMTTLKAELDEQRRKTEIVTPQPAALESTPAPSEPVAEPIDRITPPSKLPWIPIVGGLALVGVGVGFGVSAKSYAEMAAEEPVGLDAESLQTTAQDNATIANVMFVVGGAALVSGIVWEVIVLRRQRKKTDLPNPRPIASAHRVALEFRW